MAQPNKRAVRRWLHKALDGWATDLIVGCDGEPVAKKVPEWAEVLHTAGAWRWMTQRDVRRVHFDPSLQDALLGARRLGGDAAMLTIVRELVGENYRRNGGTRGNAREGLDKVGGGS
jgi:hypothetical protein